MNWFLTEDLLGREGPFTVCADYIIWYVLIGLLTAVGIYFLARRKSEKTTKIVLIVLWAITVALDLAKLILNICTDFSITWDIPFYICSLFMYVMPVAIWGKGVFKKMACVYVCTIGLIGAIINYAMPGVVAQYSLFSFRGFHTTLYHTILTVVPFIILITGYYKMKFKDFGWTFLGFVVITFPVVVFNYIAGTDYMYFRLGGLPFLENFALTVSYAWPLFMYAAYAFLMIFMQCIIIGITKLVEIIKSKIQMKKATSTTSEDTQTVSEEVKAEKANHVGKKNE